VLHRCTLLACLAGLGCDAGAGAADAAAPAADAAAGRSDGAPADAGGSDAAPFTCDWDAPQAPASGVLWAAPLAATGAGTLGGHGHDDGFGAVGFCPGRPVAGQPFYRLIAAGFETDTDVTGDGDQDDALPVDFWQLAPFDGVGESAGRVNIYVDIVGETGAVLGADSNPEIRIVRTIKDGPVDLIPLTSKPANEFQTNMPMTGGAVRYAVRIDGASDEVINMRLPVNHHVTYALVFRRELQKLSRGRSAPSR
jgi:hypothetical protein